MPPAFENKAGDPFFTKVNYVGALSGTQVAADDWTQCWTNWDPGYTDYDVASNTIHQCTGLGVSTIGTTANNHLQARIAPNPVSNDAVLIIDLPVSSEMAVDVIDFSGREVATIFRGWKDAGNSHISVDVSSLAPGIYIVHVATRTGTVRLKMTVVK